MRNWYFWLFPAAALVICGILAVRSLNHGPRIEIAFPDAEGITPGRTPVKYRGVEIGWVNSVKLADSGIVAEVELEKAYSRYAVEGSKFHLVEPDISLNGVTGLSALRDGNYIAVDPGAAGQPARKKFVAVVEMHQEPETGHNFYFLKTENLGAMSVGDKIYFRGFTIGQIFSVGLNQAASAALIRVGVMHKYAKLVRSTSVFARRQAIQADLGLFGSDIKIGSLESLFKGGIDLSSPDMKAPRAKWGTVFALSESAQDGKKSKVAEGPEQPAMSAM